MMIAASAILYMERIAVSIAAPEIIRDLRITETQMGSVFSAFYVAYTVCMIPAGALLDRFGPKRVLTAGGLGAALFSGLIAICGFQPLILSGAAFACLLAVRLCAGICVAPLYPACAKLIGNWFRPEVTARIQALIFSVTLVGMALLPVALAPIIRGWGWTTVFYALAACIAGVFALWRFWVRDRPPGAISPMEARPASEASAMTAVLRSGNVLLLAASYAMFSYLYILLESWGFYYYREVRHFSPEDSGVYLTAMLITAAITAPLGGWISDRLILRWGAWGRRAVPIAGLSLSVGFCAIGASGLSPTITATALALSYGSLSFCEAVYWAFTIETTGSYSGTACGVLNTGGNCGAILGPLITPMIASRFGWDAGLYAGALIACTAVLPWLLIRIPPSRHPIRDHGIQATNSISTRV
jgi:ACS family glucarate transporter-like MFS transporter